MRGGARTAIAHPLTRTPKAARGEPSEDDADELLNTDPLALLLGMLLDQQVQ